MFTTRRRHGAQYLIPLEEELTLENPVIFDEQAFLEHTRTREQTRQFPDLGGCEEKQATYRSRSLKRRATFGQKELGHVLLCNTQAAPYCSDLKIKLVCPQLHFKQLPPNWVEGLGTLTEINCTSLSFYHLKRAKRYILV